MAFDIVVAGPDGDDRQTIGDVIGFKQEGGRLQVATVADKEDRTFPVDYEVAAGIDPADIGGEMR